MNLKISKQASLNGAGSECDVAVSALNTFEALANNCMLLCEASLCHHLPAILAASGNKKQAKIRNAADAAVMAITSNMNANAIQEILPALFKATEVGTAWQTRTLALQVLASFGDHAPSQLGFLLPEVRYELQSLSRFHIQTYLCESFQSDNCFFLGFLTGCATGHIVHV